MSKEDFEDSDVSNDSSEISSDGDLEGSPNESKCCNQLRSHRDPSTSVNNVGSIRMVSAVATVGKMMMENHTSLVNQFFANKRD